MIRFLGATLIGLGAIVLLVDLWPVVGADASFRASALGEWWVWLHRDSLLLLQPAIERHVSPALWIGVQTLLEWPASIELMLLGAILFLLGSRRRRRR